jgi:branched-chain amino acid transport system ATP-binding protein
MAGLSAAEVDDILALLSQLKQQNVAVIMIEHVMRAVMKFSERVAVLVAGRKIADADPRAIVSDPNVIKAYLGE